MDGGQAAPQNEDAPWSLPEDFLPVPAAFNSGQQVVAPINLREYTHTSLVQLATDFNQASEVLLRLCDCLYRLCGSESQGVRCK